MATGEVHVIRIVQALGHGLDEQAVRAAERIRFKPAQREGKPVDSNVTLHIIFSWPSGRDREQLAADAHS